MHFLFLSKVSVNEPLQFRQQGPYGESCPFTGPFLNVSQIPYKIVPNKEICPFFQRPYKRSVLPCSPKAGPLWKQMSISRALLSISFGVTSEGALPPGSPHRAPLERDVPFLEPSWQRHYTYTNFHTFTTKTTVSAYNLTRKSLCNGDFELISSTEMKKCQEHKSATVLLTAFYFVTAI